MKFFSIVVAAIATILPSVMAGTASVLNNCTFPVYLRQNGMGGFTGPLMTLPAKGGFSEAFRGQGSSILLGTSPALSAPLTVEYSPNGGLVYYDLSNNAGNPFLAYRNELIPSTASCYKFNCAPNVAKNACYSNGQSIKVKTCTSTTTLAATLCAA